MVSISLYINFPFLASNIFNIKFPEILVLLLVYLSFRLSLPEGLIEYSSNDFNYLIIVHGRTTTIPLVVWQLYP